MLTSKLNFSIGLLLAGVLIAGAAHAAEPLSPATFDQLLQHALQHHPGLLALREGSEAAHQRIPQAGSLPDPQLGVTTFGESVQTRTGPQETIYSLNQSVPWFGTLGRREEAAAAEAQAATLTAEAMALRLTRDLAGVFYELAYLDNAMELTGEQVSLLREFEPIVQSKVEGGGELNALLRLNVETGRLADTLASLEQRRQVLRSRLRALLNLDPEAVIPTPVWQAPEPDLSEVSDLSNQTPDLLRLEARRKAAEARVGVAELAGYPKLMFGANYIQVGDPEVNPTTPDAGRDPWNVMAAVSIPLWRDRIRAEQAEARAVERRAALEVEQARNDLRAELDIARAGLADAHRRMNLFGNELLGLAEQAVGNSRTSYQSGRTGLLEVIDSERSLLDLQLMYWRAAADAHIHRITIQTLTTQPEEDGTTKSTKDTEAGGAP